jgi:hypothetical protein
MGSRLPAFCAYESWQSLECSREFRHSTGGDSGSFWKEGTAARPKSERPLQDHCNKRRRFCRGLSAPRFSGRRGHVSSQSESPLPNAAALPSLMAACSISIPRFNLSLPVNPWLWSGAESCGLTWDEGRTSYTEIEMTAFIIPSAARNPSRGLVWHSAKRRGILRANPRPSE